MNNKLYLIIPVFNEEEVLPITSKLIIKKINNLINKKIISKDSKILFVNDGSIDNTWELIKEYTKSNKIIKGIKLSKNKGHQNALIAGMEISLKYNADIIISIDADLQDDINAIDKMINEYYKGNDIVYGVRSSRKKDSIFKRFTAESYYKLMNKMGVDLIYNHADYRLISKRALEKLLEYKEVNLFLRGLIREIGYKSSIVYYEREKRVAGESKYPLKKMLHFAIDGITSFSIKPLKIITYFGLIVSIISFLIMGYTLFRKYSGNTVDGWTFIVISIWLIGGIQMLFLGIIGEYIGKIYSETKHRPRYFIEEEI